MTPIWLLRMAKWLRHLPSWGRVKLVVGVVLACLVLAGIEVIFGWPKALTVERLRPRP